MPILNQIGDQTGLVEFDVPSTGGLSQSFKGRPVTPRMGQFDLRTRDLHAPADANRFAVSRQLDRYLVRPDALSDEPALIPARIDRIGLKDHRRQRPRTLTGGGGFRQLGAELILQNRHVSRVEQASLDRDRLTHAIALTFGEDQAAFLEDLGLGEPALARFIRTAYGLLDLISFFTVGEDEVRAWTIRRGTGARQAAGRIHSDLERGFIRAEVTPFATFMELGSEQAVKDAGRLQVEGKDYVLSDGDIMHVRFNV